MVYKYASMSAYFIVILIFVVLIQLLSNFLKNSGKSFPGVFPYVQRRVLTVPESVFFWRLKEAFPDCSVLAQVSAYSVLAIPKGTANRQAWFNRIASLSFDFVICRADFSVVCVIELDDTSHNTQSRQATDQKKNAACSAAKVRLLRYNVKAIPSPLELRNAIDSAGATA